MSYARDMRLMLCALLASSLALATYAHADDRSAADYFADGQKLMASGSYAQACVAFEHALALNNGVGTKFNLADCYEKTRRPARAIPLFRDVRDITQQAGQTERSQTAAARLDAATKATPTVVVRAPWLDKYPNAVLFVDDKPLAAADRDKPLPKDFGRHDAFARLDGNESHASADLEADGETQEMVLAIPTAPPPKPPIANDTSQRTIGWIIGGTGLAAIAVGSTLALAAKVRYPSTCTNGLCSNESESESANSARSQANVGGVVDIVGLALVAAGATLWATAPSNRESSALRVAPAIGFDHAGVTAGGRF